MGSSYRMLIDENVERIDDDLREQGHDVERVGEIPEIDYGADDRRTIVPYLTESDRLMLTYDSHFTGQDSIIDPSALPGVLFIPDESLTPNQIVRILLVVSQYVPAEVLQGRVLHVSRHWLRYERDTSR